VSAAQRTTPSLAALAGAWPVPLEGRLNAVFVDRLPSTQTFARRLLDRHFDEDEVPQPFVVAALGQTAGRGRQGRTWSSGQGLGVWATLAVPARGGPELQSYPMRASLALAELVNGWVGGEPGRPVCRIKWPNDLVIVRRKLGGLLVDAIVRPDGSGWALVGFGLNHGQTETQLPGPETVSLAVARPGAAPPLAVAVTLAVAAVFEALASPESWIERYEALSAHAAGDTIECRVAGERLAGRFAGFDDRGFLRLETAAGLRILTSAEIFEW
jgi:BirA family biotin operon repressor/biotin-[acetyl-CoA-carboxylase] ligase